MKPQAVVLLTCAACALLVLSACATPPAADAGDMHLTIKADRVAQCKEQGGCALLSQAQLVDMLNEAYAAGTAAAVADLDSHGCRRGAT